MLLCVHINNGARHLIEASRVLYDKEYDCIWIDEGSTDYDPWVYDDYEDKTGLYIDNTTIKEYQISVTKSYGAKFSSITASNISDIYDRIEQELFEHNKVYIEMHKLTK
jgi:hypothetical protein